MVQPASKRLVTEGSLQDNASPASEALAARYVRQREDGRLARGCVAFSLDDGRAQNMDLVALHEALGQKITVGIVSDWIGQPDRLTAAQVLDLHQRGHEIANHSKTHMNMTGGTPAARAGEYDACSDWIEALTGERPATFIYPQGAWNATSDRELYGRFRSWALTASSGSNYPVPYPLGGTTPRFYRLDLDNPANLDRAKALVQLAARAPVVVAFYTHWTDQAGTMTTAQYQSIAQLAHDLHVPAVLMRDVYGSLSRLADPSFEEATTNVWMKTLTGAATADKAAAAPDAGIAGSKVHTLTATQPDSAIISQAVTVTPGKWRVSGRVKQLAGGNLATNDFGVRLKYRDWAEAALSQEVFYPALPAVGTWGRFEQDFTVPDGTQFAYLDLLNAPGVAGRGGTLHLDHIDLRPVREGGLG